jgi:indolepyruvate ferredoxin oxidoreductase beta subunit
MAQRGGSVASYLKLGGFAGPMVRRGTADLLLALNDAEACKALDYLREGGMCIANASDGRFPPEALHGYIADRALACAAADANRVALELGAPGIANMALLGFAAAKGALPFRLEQLADAAASLSREHLRALNREALYRGSQLAPVPIEEQPQAPRSNITPLARWTKRCHCWRSTATMPACWQAAPTC